MQLVLLLMALVLGAAVCAGAVLIVARHTRIRWRAALRYFGLLETPLPRGHRRPLV